MVFDFLAVNVNTATSALIRTEYCTYYFCASGTYETGKSQNFSLVGAKAHIMYDACRQISYFQHFFPPKVFLFRIGVSQLTVDHQGNKLFLGGGVDG